MDTVITCGGPMPAGFVNLTLRGIALINQHRFFAVLIFSLSVQLALVVGPTPSSAARAASTAVNGNVAMTASIYSVARTAGSIALTVRRAGGTQGILTVYYKTVDGTALSGKQYTGKTGTLTWASGDAGNKTISIAISSATVFTGTKWFALRLTAGTGTIVGSPSNATVNIVGGTSTVTKSIRDWVTCNPSIDESFQLDQALLSAANNAFTLIVDCPVRFHTGTAALHSIAVPDGVTISFLGAGEFLITSNGPPALTIAHPSEVTFLDWNATFL